MKTRLLLVHFVTLLTSVAAKGDPRTAICYFEPSSLGGSFRSGAGYLYEELVPTGGSPDWCKGTDGRCRRMKVDLSALPRPSIVSSSNPNALFGVHIHTWGDVSDQEARAVGGHYSRNQTATVHGCPTKSGATAIHDGDLGNFDVKLDVGWPGAKGIVPYIPKKVQWYSSNTYQGQKLSMGQIIGRSMVIHSATDPCTPNGQLGDRAMQCVIGVWDSAVAPQVTDDDVGGCFFKPTIGSQGELDQENETRVSGVLYFQKAFTPDGQPGVRIWGNFSNTGDAEFFEIRLDSYGDISDQSTKCNSSSDMNINIDPDQSEYDIAIRVDDARQFLAIDYIDTQLQSLEGYIGYAVTVYKAFSADDGEPPEPFGCVASCVIGRLDPAPFPNITYPATTSIQTTSIQTTGGTTDTGVPLSDTTGIATTDIGTTGPLEGSTTGQAGTTAAAAQAVSTTGAAQQNAPPPADDAGSASGQAVIAVFLTVCLMGVIVWKRDWVISTIRRFAGSRGGHSGGGGGAQRIPTDEEAPTVPMIPVRPERSSRPAERSERPAERSSSSGRAPLSPRSTSPTRGAPAAQRISPKEWNEDEWKDGWDEDDVTTTRK